MLVSHIRIVIFTLLLDCCGIIFYDQLLNRTLEKQRDRRRILRRCICHLNNVTRLYRYNDYFNRSGKSPKPTKQVVCACKQSEEGLGWV